MNKPNWENRNTESLSGWINELATLADHPQVREIWIRQAMGVIVRGLNRFAEATQPPQDERGQGLATMQSVPWRSVSGAGEYSMGFYFPNLETLQKAEDEWRALSAASGSSVSQPVEAIVSKTTNNVEPRAIESFPIEVKIDPNANKGSIAIQQPVALSTLTDEQIDAMSRAAHDQSISTGIPPHRALARAVIAASAPAQQAGQGEVNLKRCIADDKATSGEYWKGYAEGLAEDFDTLAAQYLALKNATPPQPVAAEVAMLQKALERIIKSRDERAFTRWLLEPSRFYGGQRSNSSRQKSTCQPQSRRDGMSDSYQAIYDAVRSRIHGGDIGSAVESACRSAFDMAPHHMACVAQDWSIAAYEQQRPCVLFKPTLSRDGDQYCALFGEDLVQGVCGFGKSAALAMTDFDKNWYAEIQYEKAPS